MSAGTISIPTTSNSNISGTIITNGSITSNKYSTITTGSYSKVAGNYGGYSIKYPTVIDAKTAKVVEELNDWASKRPWYNSLYTTIFYGDDNNVICDWEAIKHVSQNKEKLLERIDHILKKHSKYLITIGSEEYVYSDVNNKWELSIKQPIPNAPLNYNLKTTSTTLHNIGKIILESENKGSTFSIKISDNGVLEVRDNFTDKLLYTLCDIKNNEEPKPINRKQRIKEWLIQKIQKF